MRERPMDEYEATLRSVLILITRATIEGQANRKAIQSRLYEARAYFDSQGRTSASATVHSVLAASGLLDRARPAA
jgi:hypothetical protein